MCFIVPRFTDTDSVVHDPTFGLLCQNFKKYARELDVNETIEATKVLSFLRVPADTVIVQTLLQMLRCNINLLNLRHIMFLDYILGKYETNNHLVDALKLALPLAFQIHLPLELDNQDLPLLKDMLAYSCTRNLPDRCINNVVTGLLLHDQTINAQTAKSIIWSLCHVNCTEEKYPTRVQLLHICYDILAMKLDQLSYDDVLRTTAKIKGRIMEKHPEYYHEQLMDGVAEYVIKTYPAMLANARTNILFGFINCLANNNYTPDPDQWNEIQRQISLNPILHGKNFALPWAKLCLEMASLGLYEDKLLARVFSEEFLNDYLGRNNNVLDYLQLLTLHEAVKSFHSKEYTLPPEILAKAKSVYPMNSLNERLEECVARGLGDVLTCVKGGHPVQLNQNDTALKIPIAQLDLPPDAIV
ncbi:FAST kinase domain-containing protein 2 [Operophtera brumata]|uniref:FAST kinase domain-containing protein 2 n=1 Tax=Operophtera brumata TaxID=104452 RepID=A0A0L7KXN5_OPEBR|nr:FAST kinase domain-containing protein 2 [Operophtera brumata]